VHQGCSATRAETNLLRAIVQVLTFVFRGSGFVGRQMARVAGRGEPLPADMKPCMERLRCYGTLAMLIGYNTKPAVPTHGQFEARLTPPSPSPSLREHVWQWGSPSDPCSSFLEGCAPAWDYLRGLLVPSLLPRAR